MSLIHALIHSPQFSFSLCLLHALALYLFVLPCFSLTQSLFLFLPCLFLCFTSTFSYLLPPLFPFCGSYTLHLTLSPILLLWLSSILSSPFYAKKKHSHRCLSKTLKHFFDSLIGKPVHVDVSQEKKSAETMHKIKVTLGKLEVVECLFDRFSGASNFSKTALPKLPQYSEVSHLFLSVSLSFFSLSSVNVIES